MHTNTPILFSCPQMDGLAGKIMEPGPGLIPALPGRIDWNEFPDGWPNFQVRMLDDLQGSEAYFLASFEKPGDVFKQMSVIYALRSFGAQSLTVFLPFFSTGTMDRMTELGRIVTAKTLARMLSVIPICKGGAAEIVIADIHSMQEYHYFGESVVVRLISAMSLLKKKLTEVYGTERRPSICFPDKGAHERFARFFSDYPQIICDKKRNGDARNVSVVSGTARRRDVIIVDDLCMTGGTMLTCWEELMRRGAASTSMFVTHGVFPQNSWEKFAAGKFRNIWITDSCPQTVAAVNGQRSFEVISLAPLLSSILLERRNRT